MNVVVVVIDSLRVDHVGAYGNTWIRTPHLDEFANSACVFDQAYAEGLNTIPVRTAWFTGRFTFPRRPWMPLTFSDVALAEVLTFKGYNCALIGDCYQYHKPKYNLQRGFEYVEWIRGQEFDKWIVDESIDVEEGVERHFKAHPGAPEQSARWRELFKQYLRNVSGRKTEEDYSPARVSLAAQDWLERQKRRDNLFLWAEFFDPHEPWDPPQKYRDLYEKDYRGQDIIDPVGGEIEGYLTREELAHCKALYAGEVTLVDHWVGKLYEKVAELGMEDNTLLIYMADHGHPLGDHGYMKKVRRYLHNELVRIPLMIRHPDGIGAGERREAITETPDVMPTVLDFLGVEAPDTVDGESLLPIVKSERKKIRDYAYCGHHGSTWAIKNADWSLMLYLKEDVDGKSGVELFDLKADPNELENVVEKHPEVARGLEAELRRFVEGLLSKPRPRDAEVPRRWVLD